MALKLSPRIYGQNFKWGVLPSNKVDTVTMQPVLNTPIGEKSSFTQEVTSVTVDGASKSLPIDLSTDMNFYLASNNYEIGATTTMCINQVSGVVATGSVIFELTNPLPTMPMAKLHCEGNTYFINRGSLTHDTVDTATGSPNAVASWIYNNASGHEQWTDKSMDSTNRGIYEDPTLIDYTAKSVPLYGWVRKLLPAGAFTSDSNAESRNQPTEQDVLTTWVDQSKSSHWAVTSNWWGYGDTEAVQMWPVTIYAKGDIQSTKISLRNRTVPISAKVIKIDDYTYQVDYSIPVRYEYIASSQYYTSFLGGRTYKDLDNYCFLDRISKINVELIMQELNTETEDLSFSLNTFGGLTDRVVNEHPLSFTQNELITSETYWGDPFTLWSREMSKYILNKFKDGKYIVECEVPAAWALRNGIQINTALTIQLQDGKMISRDDIASIFEVKNIEKRFQDNRFIFALKLMEA